MKNLIFLFTVLLLVSCGGNGHKASCPNNPDKSIRVESTSTAVDYSNPAIIAGSDFGSFFQQLYKLGDYDKMIAFTSSESLNAHGRDAILDYYKTMQFGYDIDLKSKTSKDNITTLNYEAQIDATTKIVRIDVVIENDSSKIVLSDNLEDF